MNDLRDFVLNFYQANGALVEPPRYGIHEVLLPDSLAEQLDVPALQEIVFDDAEPAVGDSRLHLAQGHPLIERMVEQARRAPAPALAYVNAVRLDKRGLAEAARQALSFANARLTELPNQIETPVMSHYLVFTYKVTLTTDEKQERLATVALDAEAGWPVEWDAVRERATFDEEPAFGHLEAARPRWLGEPHALTAAALAGLLERGQRAALARMAGPIESLGQRAARYLELDRARLEQYYDDLVRDLERRLRGAEGEKQVALQDKIAAARAERQLKLADAEARYRLRTDLQLVTAQVVAQPKLELLVQIANRNTEIRRHVVWDPLLRRVEPLTCDVCGQPGLSLQLCSGGHLAHAECLLEHQCADCKRVYCRLCGEEMATCAVCGRPVCRTSLNRCGICKRGTCREHTGLCHANEGEPAPIAPPARQAAEPATAKKSSRAARAEESRAQPTARPRPAKPTAPARPPAPARPNTANWKLIVESEWSEAVVTAYVMATQKRGPAVRTWRLSPQGIGVLCNCEKGAGCPVDRRLLRPAAAQGIEAQMQAQIEELRQEYGVPARGVRHTLYMHGLPNPQPRLALRGPWKDEGLLAEARAGFDEVYARQHGKSVPPARERPAKRAGAGRRLEPHEAAEAERFLKATLGLLKLEGTLKEDEICTRVRELVQPGDWCTPEYVGALLRQNKAYYKVLASGLVATHDVSNVQALAARKRARQLPPRPWNVEQVLAAAEDERPLSELESRIESELRGLTGIEVSVRTVQREFQRDVTPGDMLASLERFHGVSDREALYRAAELIEELYQHTPRWELGGRAPVEVE